VENPSAARLALFRGVSRENLQPVLDRAQTMHVARGGLIMRHGERVPGLFAIVSGSVKTRLQHTHGDELVLALLGPGETFGETPALLRHPAKQDAVALTDVVLTIFDTHSVLQLLESDSRFSRNLTSLLAGHMDELLTQLEAGMLRSAQRLASYLDSLAQPAQTPGQWTARLPVSKTLVAAQLGVKKETLSRLLKQLATRGLISVARREITILDRARLAELATPA
jgi:CRP/FNR family transcriptional regulator